MVLRLLYLGHLGILHSYSICSECYLAFIGTLLGKLAQSLLPGVLPILSFLLQLRVSLILIEILIFELM